MPRNLRPAGRQHGNRNSLPGREKCFIDPDTDPDQTRAQLAHQRLTSRMLFSVPLREVREVIIISGEHPAMY